MSNWMTFYVAQQKGHWCVHSDLFALVLNFQQSIPTNTHRKNNASWSIIQCSTLPWWLFLSSERTKVKHFFFNWSSDHFSHHIWKWNEITFFFLSAKRLHDKAIKLFFINIFFILVLYGQEKSFNAINMKEIRLFLLFWFSLLILFSNVCIYASVFNSRLYYF